jgi:adenylate cyclase
MNAPNSVTQILAASRANPKLLAELERFRCNIAVMFTDIKGSTSYFEKYGDIAGLLMVNECNAKLGQVVEGHGGRVIKTIGDALMATFNECKEAVQSAIEMQQALLQFNVAKPVQDQVSVRIGINYGSGIVTAHDVFGDVVNVASRVESSALPDQIVISASVYNVVSATPSFNARYLGRYMLKGKGGEFELYEILWNELQAGRPAAAHTMVASLPKSVLVQPVFRVHHIHRDGSEGAAHVINHGTLSVGATKDADLRFSADPLLAPVHARFVQERAQLFVEDLSNGAGVFVRLNGTYTLQVGDVVRMGKEMLEFRAQAEALAAAAATGISVVDLNRMLDEPVAEFVATTGPEPRAQFPLLGEEITWGRVRGTYVFPADGLMSGLHARVYHRGEDYFLEDLGSRNGTFLKVRGKALVPVGTTVQVGGQLLKVTG